MRRVLLDVNVLLDAILERSPHSAAAARLWLAAETKEIEGLVPGHGVTRLFHLLAHAKGSAFARRTVGSITAAFGVAAVDQAVIGRALALAWPDFADAVCAAAAEAAGCEAIVTRDPKGCSGSMLAVLTPETAAALLEDSPSQQVDEAPATSDRIPKSRRGTLRRSRRRRSRGRGAADVVSHLAGSVVGPKSLSSNRRYLRGYGR